MTMKKHLTASVVVFSMGLTCSVFAQDYMKGMKASAAGDYVTALKEWRVLAEQGHAVAQNNIGAMYESGRGVIQDTVYAHMWYNIAASNGSPTGAGNRDKIGKVMMPAEISKAQELARECVKKQYKGC